MDQTSRITLPTRYGEATYTFGLDDSGRLRVITTPLQGMPDTVFQMTYGHDWPTVKAYFEDSGQLLPDWATAYLDALDPPGQLLPICIHYKREQSVETRRIASFWSGHEGYRDAMHPDMVRRNRMLSKLTGGESRSFLTKATSILEPYLFRLADAATLGSVAEAYRLLGALGTAAGRDRLLQELERGGRHPYARHLLFGLEFHRDDEVLERLTKVYHGGNIADDDLPAVLRLLNGYPGSKTQAFATEILNDHPYLASGIVDVMRSIGLEDKEIRPIFLASFESEKEYHHLDVLVRALNDLSTPSLSLEAVNLRAAAPEFLDVPPVNWPQQLEPGWTALVKDTPLDRVFDVVGSYLSRPEPRLQRNALLQLKVAVQRPENGGRLPPKIEQRLRELLASRYDKVYVEVLNLLGNRRVECNAPLPMVRAILQLSIGTRYRIVILKALRRVGDFPRAREETRQFITEAVNTTDTTQRLEHLSALLPYLEKYLGEVPEVRSQLERRRARVAE
ncbi:hypothetical protein [Lewinella sp. IMCC34191]|uniref:hypothetical protein n=1 Tax=Lewinella sp. IMCC34191 TaxID=2259172 RepID=UPI000E257D69|nr:hypothetical protein [Lewinella sp. IMCC34191]